jgi:murein lipoprotein
MKRAISGIFMVLLAGTVIGCATHGDLAKVQEQQNQTAAKMQEQQNQTAAKADQALQEAQSARATADAAKRQADAANAAAARAETTAKAATESTMGSATGGPTEVTPANQLQRSPDVFQKSMEK